LLSKLFCKKRIVIFPTSGLGNSLHQLSAIKNIKKNFKGNVFYSDLVSTNNIVTYFLNNILLRPWTIHQNNIFKDNNIKKNKDTIFSYIALIILFYKFKNHRKNNIKLLSGYCACNIFNTTYLFGYFQDKTFLNWSESRIMIKDSIKNLEDNIKKDILTIHIREGDPQAKKGGISFSKCTLDNNYYSNTINDVSQKYFNKIKKIYIVGIYSNSKLNKIKKLINDKFNKAEIIISVGSYLDDFSLIWNSNIVIASNSTFSFWSGYYGDSNVIYMPSLFMNYRLDESKKKIKIY